MNNHKEGGGSGLGSFVRWLRFRFEKEREGYSMKQELRRICEEAELAGHEIESLKKEAGEIAYKLWESHAWEDVWNEQKDGGLQACFLRIQERSDHIERQKEAREKLEEQIRQVMSRSYREETEAENCVAAEIAVTGEKEPVKDGTSVSSGYVCPKCQAVYRHPAKFCRRCGARMEAALKEQGDGDT